MTTVTFTRKAVAEASRLRWPGIALAIALLLRTDGDDVEIKRVE